MSAELSKIPAEFSKILAHDCRDVVRAYVAQHGPKRGLHLFARRAGVSERRARALHNGEVTRLWADEWHGACAAQKALHQERAAALRAELAEIEDRLDAQSHPAQGRTMVGVGR